MSISLRCLSGIPFFWNYCSHCPQGNDIPVILALLNKYSTKRRELKTQLKLKEAYAKAVPSAKRASNCIHCGQREAVCPQHLPARKLISEAMANFE